MGGLATRFQVSRSRLPGGPRRGVPARWSQHPALSAACLPPGCPPTGSLRELPEGRSCPTLLCGASRAHLAHGSRPILGCSPKSWLGTVPGRGLRALPFRSSCLLERQGSTGGGTLGSAGMRTGRQVDRRTGGQEASSVPGTPLFADCVVSGRFAATPSGEQYLPCCVGLLGMPGRRAPTRGVLWEELRPKVPFLLRQHMRVTVSTRFCAVLFFDTPKAHTFQKWMFLITVSQA